MNYVSRNVVEAMRDVGHSESYIEDVAAKYGKIESKYEAMFVAARHLDSKAFDALAARLGLHADTQSGKYAVTQSVLTDIYCEI